ncbi:uncharacterized protein L201_004116 [Kwoniella dendrophila CBS 6074]|uniref:Type 1 phosphatases regulator n=1 Tax=Kwoniella dendrophila CBS 6074 TaxID=1295534 RepID=A0AAX4JWJ2_9TREE
MSNPSRQQGSSAGGTAQIETEAGPSRSPTTEQPPNGVLKLRGGPTKKQKVVWSDETVDNEGMGKKKSKICCIYHKPKAFDESSDESSCSSDEGDSPRQTKSHNHSNGQSHKHRSRNSDNGNMEESSSSSSSESDGGAGDGRARPARKPRKHKHSHDCDHHGNNRVNKYDIQPKPSNGISGAQNQNGSS